ncbi:MAG: GNAT family N-acetyltransferase [Candidatus Cryosericum sp.]|nr:GNAT family N-acetyltransferase [bacterium]
MQSTSAQVTDMGLSNQAMDEGSCLVSEEMAQYFMTVDGQPGTYVLKGVSACSVRAPHIDRNRIFRARLSPESADDEIERLLLPFRRRAVPVTWYVDSCSRPNDLVTRLTSHGLELRYFWTGMTYPLANLGDIQPVASDMTVIEAISASEREQWMHTVLDGFQLTQFRDLELVLTETGLLSGRWHRLMAIRGETPVGAALLFAGDGVAGLHWLGVPQMFRKHGAGVLLSQEALVRSAKMGYSHLALQANPEVVQLYTRLGFESVGDIAVLDWRPGIDALAVEPD